MAVQKKQVCGFLFFLFLLVSLCSCRFKIIGCFWLYCSFLLHAWWYCWGQFIAPLDYSPSGSSVREILQARVLGWVAMPSRGSSWCRDWTHVSCIANRFFFFFSFFIVVDFVIHWNETAMGLHVFPIPEPLGKPIFLFWCLHYTVFGPGEYL